MLWLQCDTILGSIWAHSLFILFLIIGTSSSFYLSIFFVHLVSFHHWDAILGSNFLICSFGFSLLGWIPRFYIKLINYSIGFSSLGWILRFYISLIICLFGLSSLGPDPRFYLSFFFIYLVSHNWDVILSQFILCSFCFLLLGHLL